MAEWALLLFGAASARYLARCDDLHSRNMCMLNVPDDRKDLIVFLQRRVRKTPARCDHLHCDLFVQCGTVGIVVLAALI